MLCGICGASVQAGQNFMVQLNGFDKFDLAVATVRSMDQDADILKKENELIDGHVVPLKAGRARIVLNNVPEHFVLTVSLYLNGSRYELIPSWYANNADSIIIKDKGSKQRFDSLVVSGRGEELYALQYALDQIVRGHSATRRYPLSADYFTSKFGREFQLDKVVDKNIEIGKLVERSSVGPAAKQWILAKMFYKIYAQFFLNPLAVTFIKDDSQRTKDIEEVFNRFKSLYKAAIRPTLFCLTDEYIEFYLKYLKLEAIFEKADKVDHNVRQIIRDFEGQAREHMGYAYLVESFYKISEPDRLRVMEWLLSITKSSERIDKLAGMRTIAAGMPFPDFELTDLQGKKWRKEDFQGKVVFFDFYYTGCGNCALYFKNKVSNAEDYFHDNADLVFVSISIDKDLKVWRKSIESKAYNSASSLKLYTDGLGSKHPLIVQLRVNAYPFPILMGKTGLIETSDSKKLGSGYSSSEALIKTIEKALAK